MLNPHINNRHDTGNGGQGDRNAVVLLDTMLAFSVCFLIATLMPAGLVAPALKSLLFWSAVGAGVAAWWQREPLAPPFLTRWDEAAALLLLSILAGLWVDPAAVGEAVRAGGLAAVANGPAFVRNGTTI